LIAILLFPFVPFFSRTRLPTQRAAWLEDSSRPSSQVCSAHDDVEMATLHRLPHEDYWSH
jgi:hypothetical protein